MKAADQPGEGSHPRHRLDPVIYSPVRLSIMACLVAVEMAEFGFIRDSVEVSDSVLSKQMSNLEDARYVKVKKGYVASSTTPGCRPPPQAGGPSRLIWPRSQDRRDVAHPEQCPDPSDCRSTA